MSEFLNITIDALSRAEMNSVSFISGILSPVRYAARQQHGDFK